MPKADRAGSICNNTDAGSILETREADEASLLILDHFASR
jgi:hypothetical protein